MDNPCPTQGREQRISKLRETTFDLLVVGAGITGAGIARDAAQRGLKVALVDKDDFAAGTSSKSSKLVHGGLRYLENLEFGLVFESLRERYRQRRLNPHLVWPLSFIFPVYKKDKHSLFKINIGLWLYDLLSLFRGYRRHKKLSRKRALEHVTNLNQEGLTGAVTYYDCRADDARLTLANVMAAERDGAVVLNHVRFDRPVLDETGHVVAGAITDMQSNTPLNVQTKHIVYALGPWTDCVPEAAGEGRLIRPTKGVHIVVSKERLPVESAVVMSASADGRVVFAIPFRERTFIGTTDTDYDGNADETRATANDLEYLLETANHYFPAAELKPDDVLSTWAGLRPLIRSDAASAYATSREHEQFNDPRGITTIAGGKLTTYRVMAKEVVDHVVSRFKGERAFAKCRTHKTPLDPALPRFKGPMQCPDDAFQAMLWRHYGSHMEWITKRLNSHATESDKIVPELDYVMAQVSRAVLCEHALTLEDVFTRRLQVYYRATCQGLQAARKVAAHMAGLLGKPKDWEDAQVRDYSAWVEVQNRGIKALTVTPPRANASLSKGLDESPKTTLSAS